MYEKKLTSEDLKIMGLSEDDLDDEDVEVYPENWDALIMFLSIRTQWRTSPGGVVGLDYSVLFKMMENEGLKGDDWDLRLIEIQTLENVALQLINGG